MRKLNNKRKYVRSMTTKELRAEYHYNFEQIFRDLTRNKRIRSELIKRGVIKDVKK